VTKQKKEDVKTEDIEYERNKNELTFKPKIDTAKKGFKSTAGDRSTMEPPKTARNLTTGDSL
jgi:hypothetical protein